MTQLADALLRTTSYVSAAASDEGGRCQLPKSWDDVGDSANLGCLARVVGTWAVWLGLALLVVYAGCAFALSRLIPLDANTGRRGTFRRSREQLPWLGRAFRPRLEIDVKDADGEVTPLARTTYELLIDEMTPANSQSWFNERLVGDVFTEDLEHALDEARNGLGKVSKFLLSRLPRETIRLRVQLHQALPQWSR